MAQLLNLDTLTRRDHVLIDGTSYEMRNVDELNLYQAHRLEKQGQRAAILMGSMDSLSEEELTEFDGLTHSLLDLCIIDLPKDTKDRLTQQQRFKVIDVFTNRSVASKKPKATGRKTKTTTSASTSRGSSGSTAATQSGG